MTRPYPKVYFCGDVHGDYGHIIEVVQRDRPDAIILLGDLEPTAPLETILAPILACTTVRFIHGNHDTDSGAVFNHVFRSGAAAWNLLARIEEIGGVRIAGLGGVFREKIWMPPNPPRHSSYLEFFNALAQARSSHECRIPGTLSKQERTHFSSIFREDVVSLAVARADILVCHEAPSCHPCGFAVLDTLAAMMGVHTVFHGHHHQTVAYPRVPKALGYRVFGVGLRAITDLDGHVVDTDPGFGSIC